MPPKQHFFVHVNDRDTCGYCRGEYDSSCHIKAQPHDIISALDEAVAAHNEAQGIFLSYLMPLQIHPPRGQ